MDLLLYLSLLLISYPYRHHLPLCAIFMVLVSLSKQAPPLSPITARAPRTGGAKEIFKLYGLRNTPSTLVSPGGACPAE